MSFWTAVVIIVIVGAIARVARARYEAGAATSTVIQDPDSRRLREEVRTLKDRIAVLERLATDNNNSVRLDLEIEKLRDKI